MPRPLRYKSGDSVLLHFATGDVRALVLEDRGDFGSPPHQVVRVAWTPAGAADPEEFEVASRDLELARTG